MGADTQIASGVLGYVPEVLPRAARDWDDRVRVASWFSGLPVLPMLSGRYDSLWRQGLLTPDFFYVLQLIVAEWLGIWGFSGRQIYPGLRVFLPKDVLSRGLSDGNYFNFLSLCFFESFSLVRLAEPYVSSCVSGLMPGVRIWVGSQDGRMVLNMEHPRKKGVFCAYEGSLETGFSYCQVVSCRKWTLLEGASAFSYLEALVYPRNADFWKKLSEFRNNFRFSILFDSTIG
jgi:hypothetical protein